MFNILHKKIKIKYNINCSNEWISCDDKKLKHVLLNLISNAIKFSNDNTIININVDINVINNFSQVNIKIIDQNNCIDEHIKKKLFKKNNTSDLQNGNGLGLYICKEIIELHNDTIKHYYDTGNIFNINLKLESSNTIITKSNCSLSQASDSQRNIKINELILENNELNSINIYIIDDSNLSIKLLINIIKLYNSHITILKLMMD